jgi:hypothetical protein
MGIEQGELIIEGLTLPLALRFISGKYQGGEFPLPDEGEIVIGRSSELDMVLVEDMVSRRHAKISVEDGDIFLEDLGSTNGSFVNGEKITRTKLAEGDRILIGTSIIKLVPSDGSASLQDAKAKMNAAASSARPPAGSTMTGSIAEVTLPDLLQLFSASKKTGVLQITTETDVGSIYLEDGKVQFAVVNGDESVPPDKAFYRVLVWEKGTFDLLPKVERTFPGSIQSSVEGLLMEGMRQLDEMRRLGDALPPLRSKISVAFPLEEPLREASPDELDVIQLALNHERLVDMMNHSGRPDPEVADLVVALLEKGYLIRG